ncbi:hypothetical protein, partial [Rhizobium leguminosarum]|uniref:hypothetical protein n=1 Tax=Rhizobium leguminosarum TaxID=384 RepID=UPI001C97A3CF
IARRAYCRRVKSVQPIVVSVRPKQTNRNHNWLISLNSFSVRLSGKRHNAKSNAHGHRETRHPANHGPFVAEPALLVTRKK